MNKTKKTLMLIVAFVLVAALSVAATFALLSDRETVRNTFTVGKVQIKLDEAAVNDQGQPIDEDENVVTDLSKAERVDRNSFKLISGVTDYTKDPTVTVKKGSEDSYVRLLLTVDLSKLRDYDELVDCVRTQVAGTKDIITYGSFLSGLNTTDWVWENDTLTYGNIEFGTLPILDVQRDGYVNSSDLTTIRAFAAGSLDPNDYCVYTFEFRYKEIVPASSVSSRDLALRPLFTGIHVADPDDYLNAVFCDGLIIEVEAQAIQADGFDDADAAWAAFEAQG